MKLPVFGVAVGLTLGSVGYLLYDAGWEDGQREKAKVAQRAQQDLEIAQAVAQQCDRVLVTCQGWQARVGMDLNNVERACVTSDVIRERLKVLLERNNRAKNRPR